MTIALASDHAGFPLKEALKRHLTERGIPFEDFGTCNQESCSYVDFAVKAAGAVASGRCGRGILCCGTGIGISMAANKVRGIRAAAASDSYSVKYTRLHNDANILCMGQRVIGEGLACQLADLFLDTEFEGGRHAARVQAIMALED